VARIHANESALRYVVQATQTPALLGGFEQLQTQSDSILGDAITAAAVAFTLFVALKNAC